MKRYEVRGMMEWHPVFRVGRTRIQVSFTGGHLSAGGCTPATFETADPVVQAVIEASAAYRSGRIMGGGAARTLAPEWALPDAPCGAAVRMTALHNTGTSALHKMEFDTLEEAQDFLQRSKSVHIDEIMTPDTCMSKAAQLGIDLTIKNRRQP